MREQVCALVGYKGAWFPESHRYLESYVELWNLLTFSFTYFLALILSLHYSLFLVDAARA